MKIEDFENMKIFEKLLVILDMKIFQFITYKCLIVSKPSHIRFNKMDKFLRFYEGTRYFSIILRWKI